LVSKLIDIMQLKNVLKYEVRIKLLYSKLYYKERIVE